MPRLAPVTRIVFPVRSICMDNETLLDICSARQY